MCNTTPRVGEPWLFRRPSKPSELAEFQTAVGVVMNINRHGVDFDISVGNQVLPSLFWVNGWEPFLRLDEGETQEQPTRKGFRVLDSGYPERGTATWTESGVTFTPAPQLKPKVGERWRGYGITHVAIVEGDVIAVDQGDVIFRRNGRFGDLVVGKGGVYVVRLADFHWVAA